ETRLRFDAGENCGLEIVPALETLRRRALAAAAQLCALGPANLDVALHLLDRGAIDERPNVGAVLAPVAQPKRTHPLLQHGDERIVNAVLQNETAGRRATLTSGAERAPQHTLQREVEIR